LLDRFMFYLKRGFREFAEDVEVEAMDIWYNIKELFQSE
jgi:hypothetical protein